MDIGTRLRFYKRDDIKEALANSAKDREVGTRFEKGFGKRPDAILHPNDVLEFAKQGVTSFHVSEELWENVFNLNPSMKRKDLDDNRKGWDLILDIDSPVWEISKLITHLLVESLKEHGISTISIKFSGNKGFHIGVPFKAFPEKTGDIETKQWFPEGPRKIAEYLVDYMDSKATNYRFTNEMLKIGSIQELVKLTEIPQDDIAVTICKDCEAIQPKQRKPQKQELHTCEYCQAQIPLTNQPYLTCPECKKLIKNDIQRSSTLPIQKCVKCGSQNIGFKLNPQRLIDLDTVLISSRHLYRSMYSLHEKSGLVSIPVDAKSILSFKKESAYPDKIQATQKEFPSTKNLTDGEATHLFETAIQHVQKKDANKKDSEPKRTFEELAEQIPFDLFPPCIKNILNGMEDGKKRAMFALSNFLSMTGHSPDAIEEYLLNWNEKNPDPIREVILKGHIRYHKNKKMLPPNCRSFYQDLQVCQPENLCNKIKNPVNFATIRYKILNPKKAERAKLTEEQKEMRRAFREKKKQEQSPREEDTTSKDSQQP